VRQEWFVFLKGLHWSSLFKLSILKAILPVVAGYIVVAFCFGLLAYLITLVIIIKIGRRLK
jgi:hypothetical protein